ncbi:hypothetical protein [Paraburkholderia sp. BCC1886]|uniref:hypothetical protein n=1 Tax=Paraburkholderia sp. BCC1886 TaxID=2562670 RepID=UPI0011840F35|nr:hypothetical protein [Paraburkholderia sp. BCC1886]
MDPSKLIRDPERVKGAILETADGKLIAQQPLKLYVPARFAERGLASIGIETYVYGIYAMVLEDSFFAVSLVNAMIRIEPTSMMNIVIDGDEYYEFFFEKGATITPTTMLVKADTLVYRVFNEIIAGGHWPWYIGYSEAARILDTARYHAGANVGQNHEVTELLISMVARNPENRHQHYRAVIKSLDELVKHPPAFIPLRSVEYAADNTFTKLAGSYFSRGVVSALNSPSERQERIDSLLING